MPPVNKRGPKMPKNRKNKLQLVFDEEKRREFLSGFHKRKLQRKKKAQEDLQEQLKAERKRLKQEARNNYKKLTVSHRPIPEVEELLNKDEYETEEASVKIIELSANDIAKKNNWIGSNQPNYESDNEESENGDHSDSEEEIEGMEIKQKKTPKSTTEEPKFKTEQDLKKVLKKQATKNVQKSKAFQLKHKLEKQKMKKKSLQQKKQRIKFQSKRGNRKGGERM